MTTMFLLGDDKTRVDLPSLIDSRLLIQANSGGGKSWCLRRILEQTHGKVQHLVIDPEGEFSTLREKFDYVLAAPRGGDTVADPRSAALLAERLLELGVSAVLDIFELKAHERILFVRRFLEALVNAKKDLWHPALVVVDEAHIFCPQVGDAESAGAVIDLATRGRKRGFCAVLATQRLSKLHKDAAAECNNKLIGRTGLDVDMKRAADELGFAKDRQLSLRELEEGHFFAFGKAISRSVIEVHVGPVATSHPKAGSRLTAPPPPPTAKVRALLPKLADLPAEAEQRQKSLTDLQQENSQLKRKLTMAERGVSPRVETKVETKVERVEVPTLTDQQLTRLEKVVDRFFGAVGSISELRTAVHQEWQAAKEAMETARILVARSQRPVSQPVQRTPSVPSVRPVRPARSPAPPSEGMTGPEQRILDAIAWLEQLGIPEPEQAAVAFLAGYTIGGGAFNNPRGALRTKGLVDYRSGDRITLTDEGRRLANSPDEALTPGEIQRRVLDRLPGPEQRILKPLIEAYPDSLGYDELAELSGYSSGGGAFNNPRGRLRTLGLIDYPQPGRVVARSLLFLE